MIVQTWAAAYASRQRMGPDTGSESEFPAGLRVLVVDDDRICLLILDRLLRQCLYRVTTCERAVDALKLLRDNKDGFDVVISEAHMPDMDGYKLLELIGLEMGLPVLMMSSNGETNAAMKGIKLGACDYLVKPVRIQELKNIWKHAIRPKRRDPATLKKPQVGWSVDLHQKFVNAVNSLGIEKAVPKRILEDVASHLQKYRLYPKYTKLDNVLVEDIDVKPLATRTMPLFDQGCREREVLKATFWEPQVMSKVGPISESCPSSDDLLTCYMSNYNVCLSPFFKEVIVWLTSCNCNR